MTYDPQSNDAMFARIMERLDELKTDFKVARENNDRRLSLLENWQADIKGRIAVVAVAISTAVAVLIEVGRGMFSHK